MWKIKFFFNIQACITYFRPQDFVKGLNIASLNKKPHFLFWFAENLEPHSAPLEIAHPEVGRYFSEFSDTHYIANEELQARYPEDMCKTHRTVEELYHGLTPNSGQSSEPTANFQDHDLLDP